MLKELRTAIYNIGQTISGSYNAIYYEAVPSNARYPYIQYFLVDDQTEILDSNNQYEHYIIVQFSVFDKRLLDNGNLNSSVDCELTAEELATKFEASTLSITGYNQFLKRKQFIRPAKLVDDEKYWQIIVQYRLQFEKN